MAMRRPAIPAPVATVLVATLGFVALGGAADPLLAAAVAGAVCLTAALLIAASGGTRLSGAGAAEGRPARPADAVADDGARFRCADPAAPGRSRPRAPGLGNVTA